MTHNMRLVDFAFKRIKNKEKYNFYTKEEEVKYGALGIEIKLLSEDE